MVVFSDDVCRNNPKPTPSTDDSYIGMLCHSANPSHINRRLFIENTFSQLPESPAKTGLQSRLRCEEQFLGAFFELVVLGLLEDLAIPYVYQPPVEGCYPDFEITTGGGERVFIDVKTFDHRESIRVYHRKRKQLDKKIFKYVKAPYSFLMLNHSKFPNSFGDLEAKICALGINDHLKKHNQQNDKREEVNILIEALGLEFKLLVWPSQTEKTIYGIGLSEVFGLDDENRIRKTIYASIREQYRNANYPIIYAIGIPLGSFLDTDDIVDVVYGSRVIMHDRESHESKGVRDRDGLFTHSSLNSASLKKITAVLCLSSSCKANDGKNDFDISVFHNPYSNFQLPSKVFKDYRQVVYIDDDPEEIGSLDKKFNIDPK